MRVAALQHDILWEQPAGNFARLAPRIQAAAAAGADLIVLSEMYATGFSMATERIAEGEDGPSVGFLRDQAARCGAWLCGSVPVRAPGGARPYNQLIAAGPDGSLARYNKLHPFTYAGEHEHYQAGAEPLTTDIAGVRTSLFVCYDLRFADAFWALAPATDLYVVVANWPASRRLHWQALLQARAIENQAYVVGVNRVGEGAGLTYAGDSRIIDPQGEILAAGAAEEVLLVADVRPERVADTRRAFPFLQDRRSPRAPVAQPGSPPCAGGSPG